nr:GNAT family N-acetyltransferase [uncultured Psychroserpens sp.]
MDYHQDRFDDFSLMLYKNEKLIALLPANRSENVIHSHQGLSYGGLLLSKESRFIDVIDGFKQLLKFSKDNGISELKIKILPRIYNSISSEEMYYIMFKLEAQLFRRDVSMVIDNLNPITLSSNRKRNLKKAKSIGVLVKEVQTFDAFFNEVLTPNLKERHNTLPTHSVDEMSLLKTKFPNSIRQFNAYHDDKIIAGVTVFEMQNVVHAQYISTLNPKNGLGGLDAIFDVLIRSIYKNKRYFSFGISNENQGKYINQGLLHWKESFGANAISHDFYSIKTDNYGLLDNVML